MRKRLLLMAGILLATSRAFADRRPPETLCEGGTCGSSLEVPVHFLASAGAVTTSTPTFRDRGHFLSASLGEPFSGSMKCAAGDPNCTEDIRLDAGYGVFEFYSDRLPLYDVSLTINGGVPVTNALTMNLGIQFKDDLSGFAEASVTQRTTGQMQQLDVDADNFFEWTLGDPAIPDGEYLFDFTFRDRAGNSTVTPATASVTLDRVSPPFGSVVINNGNAITATPVVDLDLRATDDRTGISFVRLANSTDSAGVVFPFVTTQMSIEWRLDNSTGGVKTVYAWYRDGAGNWMTQPSSDSIRLDQFEPDGDFTFVADGENVVEISSGSFQTRILNVPLRFRWDESVAGILKSIEISGGPTPNRFEVPPATGSVVSSYIIAPAEAQDGLIELTAVFIDLDGKESAPVRKSILLNRNAPPNPTLEDLQIFTSSLTVVSQIKNTDRAVLNYTVTPDEATLSLGASSATIRVAYATAPVTFTDEGLRPNTPYFYTIRAHDQLSGSLPGLRVGPATTLAEMPSFISAPQGLEINVIRVSWGTGNNPPGTEYQLEWSKNSDFPAGETAQGQWSFRLPQDIEELDLGTTYYFHARARNSEGVTTPFVELGSAATLSYIQPQAPLSFVADEVTPTSVLWKWIRNPSTEKGFQILNSTSGLVADIPIVSSTDVYSFHETGLVPNSVISRSIFSYNFLSGDFTRSASVGATVLLPPAPPSAQNLNPLGSAITASWSANGNPTGTEYQVDIALNNTFTDRLESSDWSQSLQHTFGDLDPQTTYYVRARSRGQVFQGEQRMSDFVLFGAVATLTFAPEHEVDVSNGSAWKIYLPPNALDQPFGVGIETDPSNFVLTDLGVIQRANEKAYRESKGYRFPIPGGIAELTLTDSQGDSIRPLFKKQGKIIHLYGVSNGQSVAEARALDDNIALQLPDPINPVETKNVLVKTLRVWFLDTKTETWFRLPTNNVDLFLSQVDGGLQRIGIFAVMGAPSTEVADVVAFPVPWRPNGPNAGIGSGQTGTEADGITFGNIPQEGSIKIIDLQGGLVKEIQLNGNALEPWDVRNSDGEKVASGTYYWIAESGGNRKTGKLMVIR